MFKDQMIADSLVFLDTNEFAETVTYSGTAQEIAAVIERGQTMDQGNAFATDGYSDRAIITVKINDVSNWQQGDTFTDESGIEWEIARRLEENLALITFECISNERVPFR